MKTTLFYILTVILLCFAVCVTACGKNTETGAIEDNMESAVSDTEEYLINGFDIRAISEYPEIEAAIRNSIGVETGVLTGEDFRRVTSLDISDMDIQDIAPVQALMNLTELKASLNAITDLSPLAGLEHLCRLELNSNGVTDLTPLGGWGKIERLAINSNPITDISVLRDLTTLLQVMAVNCPVADFSPLDHVEYVEPYTRGETGQR